MLLKALRLDAARRPPLPWGAESHLPTGGEPKPPQSSALTNLSRGRLLPPVSLSQPVCPTTGDAPCVVAFEEVMPWPGTGTVYHMAIRLEKGGPR